MEGEGCVCVCVCVYVCLCVSVCVLFLVFVYIHYVMADCVHDLLGSALHQHTDAYLALSGDSRRKERGRGR